MSGKYKKPKDSKKTVIYDINSLGKGIKVRRNSTVKLNHKRAYRILDLDEFVGDRNLKNSHVNRLVTAMKRGTFRPEFVTLITCSLNGTTYRMNGQHTAWACLEMPQDWSCEVGLIEYEAKDEHDVRTLYSSIDRGSPRTKRNVINSYLAGSTEFEGIKKRTLAHLPTGFSLWFWKSDCERNKHDGDDVAFLLRTEQLSLARKVGVFLDMQLPSEQGHVFRGPVVGAMFATFERAPQIALKFWTPVSEGTGITKKSDPRLKLRTLLMQASVDSSGGGNPDIKNVSQELMYRMCITAWNAFREHRTLKIIRAIERGSRPVVK